MENSATVGGEVLFIDARKLGYMVDRTQRELAKKDIDRIADNLPRLAIWRGRL